VCVRVRVRACACVCVHIINPDFHHTSGKTFISELNKKRTLNVLYNDYEFSSIFNNYPIQIMKK